MLAPQRLQLRLGLLSIADPVGALRLELFIGLLQLAPLLGELRRHLFLERRRRLDLSATLAQTRQVLGEGARALEQRPPPPLLSVEAIHLVERRDDLA